MEQYKQIQVPCAEVNYGGSVRLENGDRIFMEDDPRLMASYYLDLATSLLEDVRKLKVEMSDKVQILQAENTRWRRRVQALEDVIDRLTGHELEEGDRFDEIGGD
jgi:hypothetical protein